MALSEFVIHNFNKVSDLLVLCRLYKPLSEVALDRHMEHLLLLRAQSSRLNFLLNFEEFGLAQLHHLCELLRAQEQRCFTELLW